jgi:hypothetical protein
MLRIQGEKAQTCPPPRLYTRDQAQIKREKEVAK